MAKEVKLSGEVCIIGAGVAGLSAARVLREAGVEVFLVDKGRRPGGRLATRVHHDRQFDFGAQYLKPHSRRAAVLFSKWRKAGLIVPWHAQAFELPSRAKIDTTSWHVGVPSQNALAQHLSEGLDVTCQFTALDISGETGRWSIIGHKNETAGPFASVFVTCPPEQSAHLLHPFESLRKAALEPTSRPCLATMVEFEEEVMVDFDAAFVSGSPLAWVCRDSAKPQRPDNECWVLHATEEWSRTHLEETPERIASKMLSAFAPLVPVELPPVSYCRSHRWRFSYVPESKNPTHLYDSQCAVGVAGDWCNTPNVDGAYWSGYDLAQSYLKARKK